MSSLTPRLRKAFQDWLVQLPKTLWEVGSQNLICAEVARSRVYARFIQADMCIGYTAFFTPAGTARLDNFVARGKRNLYSHLSIAYK